MNANINTIIWTDCNGPNRACKKAHAEGRTVHVIEDPSTADITNGRLIMPTYHYATAEEGIAAIKDAARNAKTVTNDEEWLALEAAHERPFRTRPGMNHPTRR